MVLSGFNENFDFLFHFILFLKNVLLFQNSNFRQYDESLILVKLCKIRSKLVSKLILISLKVLCSQ